MGDKFCLSCGMPVIVENQFGRNANKIRNEGNCSYNVFLPKIV